MFEILQSIEPYTYSSTAYLVNYWLHSSLFLLVALVGTKLNLIKSDQSGEKLLKVVLLLGLFSAAIVNFRIADSDSLVDLTKAQGETDSSAVQLTKNTQQPDFSAVSQRNSALEEPEQVTTNDRVSDLYQKAAMTQLDLLLPENLAKLSVWLMISYLCGVVLMLIIRLYQYTQLTRLMAHKKPILDVMLLSGLASLKDSAGIKSDIKLYASDMLTSPILLNQQEIVLPDVFVTRYSSEQQQAALAHELAHIKRNDVHWQKAFVLFEVLFFFQPLNRILRKSLHQMVEQQADDMASQWTGNPRALAEALSVAAQQQFSNRHSQWVLAMKCEKSNLLVRVENLLKGGVEKTRVSTIAGLSLLCSAITLVGPGITLSAAASSPLLAATAPQPPAPGTPTTSNKGASSHSYSSSNDSTGHSFSFTEIEDDGVARMTISYSTDDTWWKLSSELRGKIRFNEEETAIMYFPEDSKLEAKINDGKHKRRLIIGRDNGDIKYRYYVDRKKMDIAQEPQWLAQFITDLLRITGWNAKERAQRLFLKGGLGAVLKEVALLKAELAKAKYLMVLPQLMSFDEQEINLLFQATLVIKSDHAKSKTLLSLLENIRFSDSEGFTDENWTRLLSATQDIESDVEMARVMRAISVAISLESDMWDDVFAAMYTIQSDFVLANLLSELISHRPLKAAQFGELLKLAQTVQSDFELARLLINMAELTPVSTHVIPSFLATADTIESDFEMTRTLNVLIATGLQNDDLLGVINLAKNKIQSDHELASLFVAMNRDQVLSQSVRDEIYGALSEIQSDHERQKVMNSLKWTQ